MVRRAPPGIYFLAGLAHHGGEHGYCLSVGHVEPPRELIMWDVYILECNDKTLYTGVTTDINRRVGEHNRSKGGNYTRIRMPVTLVYQESYPNRSDALKREIQIKRWSKEKKLALIKGNFETLINLSKSHD